MTIRLFLRISEQRFVYGLLIGLSMPGGWGGGGYG